jgi:hypothetical protein
VLVTVMTACLIWVALGWSEHCNDEAKRAAARSVSGLRS